ncbi:hypothetical protein ABNG02_03200 [Halorubrum ejinorense]|uniref:Small CPxCG-related zinc finger protein n=1 Tax=Halorubrum ejinorense TaxID=425309 RepID=A0AAV3SW21_9EURY
MTRPDCGETAESIGDLDRSGTVAEMDGNDGGRIERYENLDRFICSVCRKPLGAFRS